MKRSPALQSTSTALLLAALVLTAGCLGDGSSPANGAEGHQGTAQDAGDQAAVSNASWPIPLVRVEGIQTGFEADAACTSGGAPKQPRVGEGRVLAGTDHLEVHVEVPPTATRQQVGWVLDSNGAAHASGNNRSIHWLEPVDPGTSTNQTIPVDGDQLETATGTQRWAFYARYVPPGTETDCYTGGSVGKDVVSIDAVADG